MSVDNPNAVDLRQYFERIFDEREKALNLVSRNLDMRLEKLNELRSEVMRDRDQFVRRELYDALADRLYKIEQFQSRMIGLGGALVIGSGIIGAVITKTFFK